MDYFVVEGIWVFEDLLCIVYDIFLLWVDGLDWEIMMKDFFKVGKFYLKGDYKVFNLVLSYINIYIN